MPKIESSGVVEIKLTRKPFNELPKDELREYLARLKGIREMQTQTTSSGRTSTPKAPPQPIKFNEDEII